MEAKCSLNSTSSIISQNWLWCNPPRKTVQALVQVVLLVFAVAVSYFLSRSRFFFVSYLLQVAHRFSPTSLASFHWLPVHSELIKNILLITFKASLVTGYQNEVLTPLELQVGPFCWEECVEEKKKVDKILQPGPPTFWNSLTEEISLAQSMNSF